ncbi:MAG TPA: hypothetical protein PKE69_08035 [Pyrinomonadaceae bacterium]|nr:hypothetical protein [Pyrinomonadaceae bacterium]
MKLFILVLTLGLTILLSNFYVSEKTQASPNDLVVHEWGTFTSIAGKNGMAIDWRPLSETSDLPKFVYTMDETDGFRETYETRLSGKTRTLAKVRMETPVIYFYTKHEQEISVKVDFPGGKITEWYPQASVVNKEAGNNQKASSGNGINWGTIKLLPNETPNYLRETSDSHYYPARETDAVAVQVCNADKTKIEKEKFLFYRGIGNYGLPLSVKIDGKNLTLKDLGTDEVKNIIIFENRGGRIGFKFIESLSKEIVVIRPETNKTVSEVFAELEKILVAEGLYQKEAKAMIETWKDSWFEEGLRVFYTLTQKSTDKILPLQVEPKPKETVRVFVGRAEVITPEMEQDVRKQVGFLRSNSKKIREQAQAHLKKYGRFYEPILKNILETEKNEKVHQQIQELIALS